MPADEEAPSAESGRAILRDRITVVLLTFNCAHRVRPTLDRLLELDVPVIVVDNASSDDTVAVLHEYPQLEVVALDSNIGAAGRNEGVARAQTPYVAFCDDDGWWERDGLVIACDRMDANPSLAVVNARILVGETRYIDPISIEMADSPLVDRVGVPGIPILGFMAGASVFRAAAFRNVGGYDIRYFMGGEEETIAVPLEMAGWQLRYLPEVVAHHRPSMANATRMRAFGMRNTLVNAWLHRPIRSALRWTMFTLADSPKNQDWLRGVWMTLKCLPWIVTERARMDRILDADLSLLDSRRFATRRPLFTRRAWSPEDVVEPIAE